MTSRFPASTTFVCMDSGAARRGGRRRAFAALMACVAGIAPLPAVAACLADTREIKLNAETSVRTGQYICNVGEEPGQKLRVEFHRLSDMAASVVLAGKTPQALAPVLGDARLVKTAPGDAYDSLLKRFGVTVEADYVDLNVLAPKKGQGTEEGIHGDFEPDLYKRFAGSLDLAFEMASPADFDVIHKTKAWPETTRFFYGAINPLTFENAPYATTLWKYVTRKDIDNFSADWKAINKLFKQESREPESKYINLIDHLSKEFWPADLLVGWGGLGEGCEPGLTYRVMARPILLEVAVVENISAEPVNVGNLLGAARDEPRLRAPMSLGAAADKLPLSIEIPPGDRVVVPLKIAVFPPPMDDLFKEPFPATYETLKNAPQGATLKFKSIDGREYEKTAESFKAPSKPAFKTYVYGPEIDLAGLEVNGAPVLFQERSANFLDLTGQNEGGSCPVLYVWRDVVQDWARRGKVIHDAKGRANAMTERVDFKGFVTRFRLAEEEFERAFIDRAALVLTLKDGREVWLKPNIPEMAEDDGEHQKIVAGQVVEFSYDPPKDIAEDDVAKSSLLISGYYERYSDLHLTAN